ncbi:hypothetical protein FKP32DRAFT_1559136 [Trametes sanguinea]|nr:hypothetical protein FKP32DRAFT_1559136 [Trametes sanguinea]
MSTVPLLPGASVAPALAQVTVDARSAAVVTLSNSLDKELHQLRETLWLPRDPNRWAPVLAARLACHERVFQLRALQEILIHRDMITRIYIGTGNETGDLLDALSSSVGSARRSFNDFEAAYEQFTGLRNGFLFKLDIHARNACDAAQLTLHRVHGQLYGMLSKLIHDVCEWDDCFRTVIASAGVNDLSEGLQARRFKDAAAYEAELEPLFSRLRLFSNARRGMLMESAKLRQDSAQKWSSEGSAVVPIDVLLSELQQIDELSHLVFAQSNLQSQTIRSIMRIVQDASEHTTMIRSVSHAMLPLTKVHEAFHRYDAMRVQCAEIVHCCEDAVKIVSKHVQVLEKARDAL